MKMRNNLVNKLNRKLFNARFMGGCLASGCFGYALTYTLLSVERSNELESLIKGHEELIFNQGKTIKENDETINAQKGWLNIKDGIIKTKNKKLVAYEKDNKKLKETLLTKSKEGIGKYLGEMVMWERQDKKEKTSELLATINSLLAKRELDEITNQALEELVDAVLLDNDKITEENEQLKFNIETLQGKVDSAVKWMEDQDNLLVGQEEQITSLKNNNSYLWNQVQKVVDYVWSKWSTNLATEAAAEGLGLLPSPTEQK